ncbi:MAG: hypothetical protein R6X31_00775 [Anaerolineae bacterium]
MTFIDEWNQDDVVGAVSDEIEANMEIAAKVVESDARRNLLKIGAPDWGAGYRKLLALYRLTSFVERSKTSIEAGIGLPGGKAGHDGWYIETGSSTAPAHPWLRPALLHNLRNIIQLLGGR